LVFTLSVGIDFAAPASMKCDVVGFTLRCGIPAGGCIYFAASLISSPQSGALSDIDLLLRANEKIYAFCQFSSPKRQLLAL
jgi:hypothetical protein